MTEHNDYPFPLHEDPELVDATYETDDLDDDQRDQAAFDEEVYDATSHISDDEIDEQLHKLDNEQEDWDDE